MAPYRLSLALAMGGEQGNVRGQSGRIVDAPVELAVRLHQRIDPRLGAIETDDQYHPLRCSSIQLLRHCAQIVEGAGSLFERGVRIRTVEMIAKA